MSEERTQERQTRSDDSGQGSRGSGHSRSGQDRRGGRGSSRGRGGRSRGGGRRRYGGRRKHCTFCAEKVAIDYKTPDVLRYFLTEQGKIRARRQTGVCARHQRQLATAIKRARHLAMLPFVSSGRPRH